MKSDSLLAYSRRATLLLVAGIVTARGAATDLMTVKFQYESAIATAYSQDIADRTELGGKFTNALNGVMLRAQEAGDLDAVRVVLEAQAAFSKNGTVLAPPDATTDRKVPADLKQVLDAMGHNIRTLELRTAREVLKLAAEYDRSLLDAQTALTKAGRIDEALAAQRERGELAASPELKSARTLLNGGSSPPPRVPVTSRTVPATAIVVSQPVTRAETQIGTPARLSPRELEKRLEGTAWSYGPARREQGERAVLLLQKGGTIKRMWSPDSSAVSFRWKVRDDGVVELRPAADQSLIRLLRVNRDLKSGEIEMEGETYPSRQVDVR